MRGGRSPALLPLLIPATHTLSTGLDLSGHRGQDRFAPSKEASSQPPSSRKFIEIAAWSADHHDQIIRRVSGLVTIKREALSLYYARLNKCVAGKRSGPRGYPGRGSDWRFAIVHFCVAHPAKSSEDDRSAPRAIYCIECSIPGRASRFDIRTWRKSSSRARRSRRSSRL